MSSYDKEKITAYFDVYTREFSSYMQAYMEQLGECFLGVCFRKVSTLLYFGEHIFCARMIVNDFDEVTIEWRPSHNDVPAHIQRGGVWEKLDYFDDVTTIEFSKNAKNLASCDFLLRPKIVFGNPAISIEIKKNGSVKLFSIIGDFGLHLLAPQFIPSNLIEKFEQGDITKVEQLIRSQRALKPMWLQQWVSTNPDSLKGLDIDPKIEAHEVAEALVELAELQVNASSIERTDAVQNLLSDAPIHPLLEKFIAHAKAEDLPSDQWQFHLAIGIVTKFLGTEFLEKEFLEGRKTSNLEFKDSDAMDLWSFADLLWIAKGFIGFDNFIENGKTKTKDSLYYELRCAVHLSDISDTVEFVIQSGNKGEDYDLLARNCMEFEKFPVEVKAREEVFQNEKSLQNFLKKAKDQLPREGNADGNAAIMFKIKLPQDRITQADLNKTISRFVKNTTKLSHIFYLWPTIYSLKDGRVLNTYKLSCVDETGPIDDGSSIGMPGKLSYIEELERLGYCFGLPSARE